MKSERTIFPNLHNVLYGGPRLAFLCMTLFMLMASVLSGSMMAYGEEEPAADPGKVGSLTINYAPVKDVEFRLYYIGYHDGDNVWHTSKKFKKYRIDWDTRTIADTLRPYIDMDGIEADMVGRTNADGILYFADLKEGAYIALGDSKVVKNVRYIPKGIQFSTPAQDGKGAISRDVVVHDKCESEKVTEATEPTPTEPTPTEPTPTEPTPTELTPSETPTSESVSETETEGKPALTIKKNWKNVDASDHPDSIEVEVRQDGNHYERITLNRENNWTWTYESLPGGHDYDVAELNVPKGYKVSLDKNKKELVITNRKESEKGSSSHTGNARTGQLWWPVLVLTSCGLFLILVGMLIKRRRYD